MGAACVLRAVRCARTASSTTSVPRAGSDLQYPGVGRFEQVAGRNGHASRTARAERNEQAAVFVVRGEEIRSDRLRLAGTRPEVDLLSETPDAPLERQRCGVPVGAEAVQPQPLDEVTAE